MIYTLAIVFSILFMIFIILLVRNNKLEEKYSILWILFSVIVLIISIFPKLIDKIATMLTVSYPPSLVFLLSFIVIAIYIIHLSIVATKQNKRIIRLTQDDTILKYEIEKLKKENKK